MSIGKTPHGALALAAIALLPACQALLESQKPLAICGDNQRDPEVEECDDGNTRSGDDCSSQCRLEVCGDGILAGPPNEECDDGPNNDNGGECTQHCKKARCGDGLLNTRGDPRKLEVCDDGNLINGDGCNSDCSLRGRVRLIGGTPGGRGVADGIGSVARFGGVTGLAAAARGEYLYVADQGACAIRRLRIATGLVDTVAGQVERCANRSSDGPGAEARFAAVHKRLAVAGDALFVAEGHRLRRVDLSDEAHHVSSCTPLNPGAAADTGADRTKRIGAMTAEPDGSGLYLATADAIYHVPLPCTCNDRATPAAACRATLLAGSVMPSNRAKEGRGTEARFARIVALARDPTRPQLVVADLRWLSTLDLNSLDVRTVAGNLHRDHLDGQGTAARFYSIRSLAFDGSLLYAVEQTEGRVGEQNRLLNWGWASVRRIDPSDWQVTTVAGTFGSAPTGPTPETDGFGPHARFVEGEALAVAQDTLFIGGGASIRAVSLASKQVVTAAGQLVRDFTYYRGRSVTSVNGSLYAVGRDGLLREIPVERSGPVRTIPLCESPARVVSEVRAMTAVDCERTEGRCADGSEIGGAVFVADEAIAGICRVDLAGKRGTPCCRGCTETCERIFTTGPLGSEPGQFARWGVSGLTTDGTHLYLLARTTRQLIRLTPSPDAGPPIDTYEVIDTPAPFQQPWGLAYYEPHLYVSDEQANVIFRIDPKTGAVATLGDGKPKTRDGTADEASFCHPVGIVAHAVDIFVEPLGAVATTGKLFVGEAFCSVDREEWNGHAVREINLGTQTVSTLLGPGPKPFVVPGTGRQASVNWPASLTYDSATGALYAADLWDHVLLQID